MAGHEPTNLPQKDADFERRSSHLAVFFHPKISLVQKAGHEFAALLSEVIDPSSVELRPHKWVFKQPLPKTTRGSFQVQMTENQIEISATFPTKATPEEWVEDRQTEVLNRFASRFGPELTLGSLAMIRETLPMDGDARLFLTDHVMKLDRRRVNSLRRPIHLVGLRFSFPPYQVEGEHPKHEDWALDVKAESLNEDPSRLFFEVRGTWQASERWDDETVSRIIARLVTVRDFVRQNLLEFLERGD